jgi:hypothetical protein
VTSEQRGLIVVADPLLQLERQPHVAPVLYNALHE